MKTKITEFVTEFIIVRYVCNIKSMKKLTELKEWYALSRHHAEMANQHMRAWFEVDQARFSRFTLQVGEIFFDFSRNRIHPETINLLSELASVTGLSAKIEALFTGYPINTTENRPALHTALRDPRGTPIFVDEQNIATLIAKAQEKMRCFVSQIHTGVWQGVTGKAIKQVVNIGMGGSYLGPMMTTEALKDFA